MPKLADGTIVPDTADNMVDALLNPAKAAELLKDPAKWQEYVKSYAKSVLERDPDLQTQLKESQGKAFEAFLRDQGIDPKGVKRLPMGGDGADVSGAANMGIYKRLGLTAPMLRQIAAYGEGPGMELVGKFPRFRDFAKGAFHGTISRSGVDARMKLLGEGAGDQGGFLVPEEFRAELLSMSLESAVVRPRARVIPMTREVLTLPTIRDANHASNVFGGVTWNWVAEGGDLSSTTNEPTFAQLRLIARKLSAYTVASNELLADSAISLEAILMQLFSEALAYAEDDAFIAGSGAGQPLGVLNADALISVAAEGGQAATTILWENLVKMFARQLPQGMNRAVWYAHPDTFPQLATMSLAVGTGGSAVWLQQGVGAPPTSILGRPVIFTEKAETLGTAGDIVFADFSQYLIGDRQALAVASSPHVRFTTDQTVWRFIQRVDGRPWLDTALTPRNGTTTMSAFVALATR